jgi:hypothetical protein
MTRQAVLFPAPRYEAFYARRNELRSQRRHHTEADLPGEFNRLTVHIRQSLAGCGESHAEGVARSFGAEYGWDPADLMRGALRGLP